MLGSFLCMNKVEGNESKSRAKDGDVGQLSLIEARVAS